MKQDIQNKSLTTSTHEAKSDSLPMSVNTLFIDVIRAKYRQEKQKLKDLYEQIRLIQDNCKVVEQNIIAYERAIRIELERSEYCPESAKVTNYPDLSKKQTVGTDEYDEDRKVQQSVTIEYFGNSYSSSNLMDMLCPRFKGLSLSEVTLAVLEQNSVPMTIAQITKVAYDISTEEEFKRAKGSIGATLRNGVNKKDKSKCLWLKIDRGIYVGKNHNLSKSSELLS